MIRTQLAAVLAAVTLAPISSYALVCGQVIAAPGTYNFTADVGPCAGDGLVVQSSDVIINMNGYTLSAGRGNVGRGIYLQLGSRIEINGKGTITGFQTGIRKSGIGETGLTIYQVTLTRNVTGIFLDKQINALIANNSIDTGVTGIGVSEGNKVVIEKNGISGLSGAGISISNSLEMHVDHNKVTGAQDGLVGNTGPAGLTMRVTNNSFSSNTRDGARVNTSFGGPVVFYSNTAASNLRDGIAVTGAFASTSLIVMGNSAQSNGRYGIGVNNDKWRVARNSASTNTTADLFWDGVGASTCFVANAFTTSIPGVLPVCP